MALTPSHFARIGRAALTRRVPVYVHYGVTHRCDLTCKMCGIWRYGNRKEELELPDIERMAARLARMGCVQLAIGGGEPFARDDIHEICARFVQAGLNVRLLTNGVNVGTERLEQCVRAGVRNYSISLDSLRPALFDHICEQEGSWRGAVTSMTWLASRLARERGRGMLVVNCVVSALNLEEVPDLVRFARRIGFAVSLLPVELLPDAKAGVRNWEARFIRYRPEMALHADEAPEASVASRVDAVYDQLVAMKRKGWPILNSTPYLESSRIYLKTGRFPAEGCDAGRLYFSISPNGQFTICHRTSHSYRHILDDDFEEYFHSAEYERARLLESGACEGCMRACWIDTSSMFRTLEGFFDTARLTLRGPPTPELDTAAALAMARA